MYYTKLRFTSCSADEFRKHGYWYLITSCGAAHTAFRTREGFISWLQERHLKADVPEQKGVFTVGTIEGSYKKQYVWSVKDLNAKEGCKGVSLNNGDYTDCVFAKDGDVVVEYLCNPNVSDRVKYAPGDKNYLSWR